MLGNHAGLQMLGGDVNEIFRAEKILEDSPDVLLLTSCGSLDSDISNTRKVQIAAPDLRIVMFGDAGAERKFLQYVRAGIHGYLLLGASVKEVWEALEAVHAGKACCPSSLCGLLFDYFEREATSLPSGAVRQQLGLTRREQQLIPLIAQGLTNKEIANRVLSVGANGEESFIPYEAQGRRGQPAGDRTLQYPGISVVGCTSAVARCLLPK